MDKNEQEQEPSQTLVLASDIHWVTHFNYLKFCINGLPAAYGSMDPNRLTLTYFVISSLDLLGKLHVLSKKEIIDWIYSLQVLPDKLDPEKNKHFCGWRGSSFGGAPFDCSGEPRESYPHDQGHVAMTYVALALLLILGDDFSRVNKKAIIESLKYLQQPSGSVSPCGDGSECDMRYVYCCACVSYMLNDWSGFDVNKTVDYILKSQSYDYAIAQGPGEESHGGSTYCAVATLALMGRLYELPHKDKLVKWLIQRQEIGFNGRPNKLQDTCYSFWVGATLRLLDQYSLVHEENIRQFVVSTQRKNGGFSKWPQQSQPADPLHTYFGFCGLSFAGEPGIATVHPAIGFSRHAHDRLLNLYKDFVACKVTFLNDE